MCVGIRNTNRIEPHASLQAGIAFPAQSVWQFVLTILIVGILGTVTSQADVITVCLAGCDHDDIQSAIDASSDGDVIQIESGIWQPANTLDPNGRAITLEGSLSAIDGSLETVIDGQGKIRILECQSDEGIDTVFKNLIIRNGFSAVGGGMRNRGGSDPLIQGCVFIGNFAIRGGAVFIEESATPTFESCRFEENTATGAGSSGDGGAICSTTGYPNVNHCTFVNNHANDDGGAIFGGVPLVYESQFIGNTAIDDGGAVFGGAPRFLQCVFVDNSAGDGGGCMYLYQNSIRIDACRFEQNSSGASGGVILTEGSPVITESVFRNNFASVSAGAIFSLGKSASPRISDTLICGNGSDQLVGLWTDQGGNTFSGRCPVECLGDFNKDGIIGGLDLGLFLSEWGSLQADLNADGLVDGIDLGILLAGWGNCSAP